MSRERAWELLRTQLGQDSLLKHSLATEAIMRALARRLGEDEDLWGLTGLLHDLDFESTQDDPTRHGEESLLLLRPHGVSEEALDAIRHHNAECLGLERSKTFHHALAAAESITGLIAATALVMPDKRIASVKGSSVRKRMKKKDFARRVNRASIEECERFGISLVDFVELSLDAMKAEAEAIGL